MDESTLARLLEQAEPLAALSVSHLTVPAPSQYRPRFLMLYGSLRARSYSRLLTFGAARLLEAMGGNVKMFDPAGLPLADGTPDTHPKV
jgi:arsenic resistance protein ArsH